MWAPAGFGFVGGTGERRDVVDLEESHPRGRGTKPSPTPSQPSHFCFLIGPIFIYNIIIKKKKITTELFELEARGRQLSAEGRELGKASGGESPLSLQGLPGESEPWVPSAGALGSRTGLSLAPGSRCF